MIRPRRKAKRHPAVRRGSVVILCELCDFAVSSDHWRPARKIIRAHRTERHDGAHLKVAL